MLIDARQVSQGSEFRCDVCVIGSGPAGIAIADRLRNSQLSVILLEAGGVNYSPTPSGSIAAGMSVTPITGSIVAAGGCLAARAIAGEDGVDRSTRWIIQGAIGCRSVVGLSAPRMWPRTRKMRRGFASWRTPDLISAPGATGWRLPSFSTTRTSRTSSFSIAPRRTSQNTYGPRLISAPNVTTILHANVTQLRLDPASGRFAGSR